MNQNKHEMGHTGGADAESDAPMENPAPMRNPALMMIRGLALDVGLPVVTYYALHLLGATDWVALLAATGVAAARIIWGAIAHRRLNQFATVMLMVYGIGLVLGLLTGDPRTLLLKDSLVTASIGAVFLITAMVGRRPLTLSALQSFVPARAEAFAEAYRTDPDARHAFRLTSTVWGAGLLAEALLRIPLVYLLPIDVGVGASEALLVVAFAILITWNGWYMRRAMADQG